MLKWGVSREGGAARLLLIPWTGSIAGEKRRYILKNGSMNKRFAVSSAILLVLVILFAWTLKNKAQSQAPETPTEQENQIPQTANPEPAGAKNPV